MFCVIILIFLSTVLLSRLNVCQTIVRSRVIVLQHTESIISMKNVNSLLGLGLILLLLAGGCLQLEKNHSLLGERVEITFKSGRKIQGTVMGIGQDYYNLNGTFVFFYQIDNIKIK